MKIQKPSNAVGYITFRKDRKVWSVRYKEYDVENAKNITRNKSFKTREEAQKFLNTIMYQKENPLYIEHNGIPLCEMMRAEEKLKLDTNQITEATHYRNLQIIEQIERFPIADENIDEISSTELQELMNYHKNLRNSSIDKLYQMLGRTFKSALNKGYIMRNPMINVLKPRSNKEDVKARALTVEEQQLFTDYLLSRDISNCKYKNVYLIQMFMGLRVGEALALTTKDIDLKIKG